MSFVLFLLVFGYVAAKSPMIEAMRTYWCTIVILIFMEGNSCLVLLVSLCVENTTSYNKSGDLIILSLLRRACYIRSIKDSMTYCGSMYTRCLAL